VYKPSIKRFTLMTEVMKSGVLKRGTLSTAICTSSNLDAFNYSSTLLPVHFTFDSFETAPST
jgi:hypothetical protein